MLRCLGIIVGFVAIIAVFLVLRREVTNACDNAGITDCTEMSKGFYGLVAFSIVVYVIGLIIDVRFFFNFLNNFFKLFLNIFYNSFV